MTPSEIRELQSLWKRQGFYTGVVDGIWGPLSAAAMQAARDSEGEQGCGGKTPQTQAQAPTGAPLAWGSKVTAEFRRKLVSYAAQLGVNPNYLMAAMAFETGEAFRPDVVNGAGSGATGLIQFMPATALSLGTTTRDLAAMTAEQQLDFVYLYFRPYKGKLKTLSDVYMAILWPAAIGKPDSHVLWHRDSRPTTYRQNMGLDVNRDGAITKGEAASKVQQKLDKGLGAGFTA